MNCDGVYLDIGVFSTPEEASNAYEIRWESEVRLEIERSWKLFLKVE
jgi:hypothetical protein